MIYFDLPNGYESFKELFGMRKTSDGKMVRKNHILLQVWKDAFKNRELNEFLWENIFVTKILKLTNQNDLISIGKSMITFKNKFNYWFDFGYSLTSNTREIIDGGLSESGFTNKVRYHNHETGKDMIMKAAKLYAKSFDESELVFYGDKMKLFCAEHFAAEFTAYADEKISPKYELHVGSEREDFETIYTNDEDFGSCMSNDGQYHFYVDAVDASAAWLTDKDENLVCRCVIFNNCKQYETNKKFRIAERQYALNQDDNLKTILVKMLYKGGYIDAHKRVGAPCNREGWREICDENGDYLDETRFSIRCTLDFGDTLSYQDTFKEYDIDSYTAQNFGNLSYQLDDTGSEFQGETQYDEWEGAEYLCNEDDMFHAYWYNPYRNRMEEGYVYSCNIENYFTRVDRGTYCREYVHDDNVCIIDGDYWCTHDDDVCEIDGYFYLKRDCYFCCDIKDWSTDAILWNGDFYANYSYSELLDEDIPDSMFDDIEENFAEENGYIRDEFGVWIKSEKVA